jgi:UDP-N-acetylmuramyl pentapeptide phosphotransferase/UDP-N-acetylglucosamine-1-phosphate transferase
MGDTNGYLIVGLFAMFVTLITTPVVRWFARERNWVALPDERKVHTVPTPNVGGIALFAGVVAALTLASRMDRFGPLFQGNSEPTGVLLGALVVLVIGARDDVKEVSKGYDCGMQIKGYNDIKEYDIIESFHEIEIKKKLK